MMLIALIAIAEATLFSASRVKQCQARRQQVLMGNANSARSLPIIDEHLKRKTAGASRFQALAASKLAEMCRQVVQTRSFEYVLLQAIQSRVRKHRSKSLITKPEVVV